MTTADDKLRALSAKWRAEIALIGDKDAHDEGMGVGLGHCANELDAALDDEHPVQDRYEHFLCYSGLTDSPVLRYAYFHGADEGMEKPLSERDAALPVGSVTDEMVEAACAAIFG